MAKKKCRFGRKKTGRHGCRKTRRKKKMSNPMGENYSKAKFSSITSSDEDEAEEKRRKLQLLDNMVTEKVEVKLQEIKTQINQDLQNFLAQLQAQPQSQTAQSPTAPEMPAEIKAEAIAKVGGAVAEVVKAWKGATAGPTDDYFGQMSKNMMLQIIQAGLDGIFKNVYPTYNPTPPVVQRFEPQGIPRPPGKITFE